jgi:hypothetical protein
MSHPTLAFKLTVASIATLAFGWLCFHLGYVGRGVSFEHAITMASVFAAFMWLPVLGLALPEVERL